MLPASVQGDSVETGARAEVPGWAGRLELAFALRDGRTKLTHARHQGPLRVQRPFHPEGNRSCHCYVLHPPGGVVGGDRLTLDVTLHAGAHALLTTPAATKFYRSAGPRARQVQRLRVGEGCRVEFLPQENIAFDGAEIELETEIELAPAAELILCDVLCLGRPATEERFTRGRVLQSLAIRRAGEPLMLERARYLGGDVLLDAAFGLGSQPVVGALTCVSDAVDERTIDATRDVLAAIAPEHSACTRLPGALVCRYLGPSTERAQLALRAAWGVLRERCFGLPAIAPRIWAT